MTNNSSQAEDAAKAEAKKLADDKAKEDAKRAAEAKAKAEAKKLADEMIKEMKNVSVMCPECNAEFDVQV